MLNLVQVTDAQDLPPVWEALARASKHQQLLVLQRAFDGTVEEMGLRAPTIATPSLLKLVLALGFRMESRYDLTTGLHPFVLGHHGVPVRLSAEELADRGRMLAEDKGVEPCRQVVPALLVLQRAFDGTAEEMGLRA